MDDDDKKNNSITFRGWDPAKPGSDETFSFETSPDVSWSPLPRDGDLYTTITFSPPRLSENTKISIGYRELQEKVKNRIEEASNKWLHDTLFPEGIKPVKDKGPLTLREAWEQIRKAGEDNLNSFSIWGSPPKSPYFNKPIPDLLDIDFETMGPKTFDDLYRGRGKPVVDSRSRKLHIAPEDRAKPAKTKSNVLPFKRKRIIE